MYQVIAKFHALQNDKVQTIFLTEKFDSFEDAEEFIERQKNHPSFCFEIINGIFLLTDSVGYQSL